jgi:hypothetical protein
MTTQVQDRSRASWVAVAAIAAGAVISVALGVYGSKHQPAEQATWMFGFTSMISMKVWLASLAGALALVQVVSALWLFGKLGRPAGPAVGLTHRVSGTLAVLLTLPIAFHCLWSLGFQSTDTRVLVHALFGCTFYGAFVTKILALKTKSSPGWLLPVAGGLLFSALVLVVSTSAIWYFKDAGLPTG